MFSKGGCFHDFVEVDQVHVDDLAAVFARAAASPVLLVPHSDAHNMSDAVVQAHVIVMTCPFAANPETREDEMHRLRVVVDVTHMSEGMWRSTGWFE